VSAGPYSIGSSHWPGISKLTEEMGETGQVIGKLLGTGGEPLHWDGSNLPERLIEEMGDVIAAIWFVVETNGLDNAALNRRSIQKLLTFREWHLEQGSEP
jgi:NTP pyrophosphatase (non-canonical NTP hydrolase)